jgi:hypothetical protein
MRLPLKWSAIITSLVVVGILTTVRQFDNMKPFTGGSWFESVDRSSSQYSSHIRRGLPRSRSSLIVVDTVANFADRVHSFNDILNNLRRQLLKQLVASILDTATATTTTTLATATPLDVVSGIVDNYVDLLATNYSHVVTTVVLPWLSSQLSQSSVQSDVTWNSLDDTINVELQRYYRWTADDQLCGWIETPGVLKQRYDVIYDRKCERNVSKAASGPSSLPLVVLNGKPLSASYYWPNDGNAFPAHVYKEVPPYVFHLHIYRDALVTAIGDVISKNTKMVQYR